MAESVRGVYVLQEELERAKESLKDVDENIKKLTGREPGEIRAGRGRGVSQGGGRGRPFTLQRRGPLLDVGGQSVKRHLSGGAFSRLGPRVGRGHDSGEDDEVEDKPAIQSSVVATPKDTRSRQDLIQEQGKDKVGRARNRRMFGLLLGTLQQFKKDTGRENDRISQRKAVEDKLEAKAIEEKEELKREREHLYNERKAKQLKLRRLEQKMEIVQIHEDWEKQTRGLMNFIKTTKAKPPLFYKPKAHTSATERRLKETKKALEAAIRERRKHLEEEIEELTRKDEEADAVIKNHRAEKNRNEGGHEEDLDEDEAGITLGEEEEVPQNSGRKVVVTKTEVQEANGDANEVERDDENMETEMKSDSMGKAIKTEKMDSEQDNHAAADSKSVSDGDSVAMETTPSENPTQPSKEDSTLTKSVMKQEIDSEPEENEKMSLEAAVEPDNSNRSKASKNSRDSRSSEMNTAEKPEAKNPEDDGQAAKKDKNISRKRDRMDYKDEKKSKRRRSSSRSPSRRKKKQAASKKSSRHRSSSSSSSSSSGSGSSSDSDSSSAE